jgi:hypothetical protein
MEPGDYQDALVSKIPHFIQIAQQITESHGARAGLGHPLIHSFIHSR